MNSEEKIILKGIISGEESAYKQLFDMFYAPLTVFAKKYLHDLNAAKEIVQIVFVNLYEKRTSLNISNSIKSYLFQSVKNACLNFLKHNQIHLDHLENLNLQLQENSNEWNDKMLETELEYNIYQAVSHLPLKCREIFTMSRMEGKSNLEISAHFNISKRTVETQISKALKILRKELAPFLKLLIFIAVELFI